MDRTEIPGGSAYNMVDFIPDEVQAVTAGRGGWTYAGAALSGATSIKVVGYHPDTNKIVAVDQADKLWDVAAATSIGTLTNTAWATSPSYHRGYLIFPGSGGGLTPDYYKSDGTIGTLAAAPTGKYICVYKDHTVLASSLTNLNRVWFSAAGDPTTWDTTFGWWDTSGEVVGVVPLTNALLILHKDQIERLRGTTPPPGSDMVLEPFLDYGCIDERSLVLWRHRAVFASAQGIFMTDGASDVDLTAGAQMKTYWQSLIASWDPSTWQAVAGLYRDHYIISIHHGTTLVDCLCLNLPNQTMWRFTNLQGSMFYNLTTGSHEKLYMGQSNAGRVIELSSLWSPSATAKQDGDGTNPTPIVETGMFRGFDRLHRRWIESMGKQKWRFGYVDYDLRDAASDNPTAALSYCTSPTGSYTQAGLALPETTDVTRKRRSFSPTQGGATHSQMLGLKFAVTGPYSSAKLYTLEGSFEPIEIGAL